MGWSLRESIERIDRMLVYGPSSLFLTVVWLSHYFYGYERGGGEKLDGDPQIGQPVCWGCSREFLFLRCSDSVQLC
jgi:hypothetical protein